MIATEIKTRVLNSGLQIVDVSGKKFMINSTTGYIVSNRKFAFYIHGLGYLKFKNEKEIYMPLGGKKALQSIINMGGFLHYEDMDFVNPIN